MKICVVGGGPAGCSFAIRFLRRKRGDDVYIFEGKDFDLHYNQCIGVLSPPLEDYLREYLGVQIPEKMIKRRIKGYIVHDSKGNTIYLEGDGRTVAVRRVQFDKYMLDIAQEHGAKVIRSRVTDVEIGKEGVMVFSENLSLEADFIVGAFGFDKGTTEIFRRATGKRGYREPSSSLTTFITKIHLPQDWIELKLDNIIHAFLVPEMKKVEFGAITPKGDHIDVNIAGRKINAKHMKEFLNHPYIRKYFEGMIKDDCPFFKGVYPTKPARGIIGERYVVIGDAAGWIRPYKGKGINTAIRMGVLAADALSEGNSPSIFFRTFSKPLKEIMEERFYGRIFTFLVKWALKLNITGYLIEKAKKDENLKSALYNAVSGEGTYEEMLKKFIKGFTKL